MVLDIIENIEDLFNKFGKFVENNFDNPFLWIVMFLILLLITSYVISELGGK